MYAYYWLLGPNDRLVAGHVLECYPPRNNDVQIEENDLPVRHLTAWSYGQPSPKPVLGEPREPCWTCHTSKARSLVKTKRCRLGNDTKMMNQWHPPGGGEEDWEILIDLKYYHPWTTRSFICTVDFSSKNLGSRIMVTLEIDLTSSGLW